VTGRSRWAAVSSLSAPAPNGALSRLGDGLDRAGRSPLLRRLRSAIFWGLCGLALLAIVIPLLDMIATLIQESAPLLNLNLFTHTSAIDPVHLSAPVGVENGILGSLLLGLGVMIVAGTVGVLAGLYIVEFAPPRPRAVMRFFSEVLSGVPSIVVGLVAYTVLVNGPFQWHYSLIAAVIALSVITTPYIVKNTEVAFDSVPRSLREGAAALGLSRLTTIRKVLLPPALPGIVGGLILAQAIAMGETAPLLFTANWTDFNPVLQLTNADEPYLTGITFNTLILPYPVAHQLAAAAALVTVGIILLLLLLGRAITARSKRMTARMDL
jgi:phosphate transport system permease protein